MENIVIESGPVVVIASGTVITFKNNPIELTLGGHGRFKMIMIFNDEESEEDSRVEPRVIGPSTIEVTFFNCKDPLGSGNSKPVHLGTIGGRTIYMNYRIYSYFDSDKTVHYTFYCTPAASRDVLHTGGFHESSRS